jgi:hypothetical protein
MIDNWDQATDVLDERGHAPIEDGMDPEIVRLLYEALHLRHGIKQTEDRNGKENTMGNAKIAAWQKACGIEPATGKKAKILGDLQKAAFQAIRICELEQSGIRDGDGHWYGSDVIGSMVQELTDLCRRLDFETRSPGHKQREILLDIKTTGASPADGHRVVEIKCTELINRVPSGHTFHAYFNHERGMPAEALAVHSLSEDFLKDKPAFAEAADDLIAFLGDAQLGGNVDFDLGFLNAELERAGKPPIARERFVFDFDKVGDYHFGVCPVCHKTNGYLNAGRSHRFYCEEHRKSWCVGSNLFSSWRFETEEEQRRKWDEIGLDGFEEVEPYSGPPGFWEAYNCLSRRSTKPPLTMTRDSELGEELPF